MDRAVRQHAALPVTQRGAAVLMLLLIMAVSTAIYFLVHELNNTRLQIERDKINAAALAQARDAVLGFALANQDMPGGLPFPDRAGDGEYNGNGDCVSSIPAPPHHIEDYLLGKFPFLKEQGCGSDRAFDITPTDASGERLWYAASKNLVKSAGGHFPKPTNTSTLMASSGWLNVVNESGAVLPVAFILIAPGEVLPGQNRAGAAPNASNYLDHFIAGATTYDNANGAVLNSTGFITARPVNDATNHFNDRLLYVTRDEFVNRLVWRIADEIRSRLDQYHTTHYRYPFAAPLSDGECVKNTFSGFIPITDVDLDCNGALAAFPSWWADNDWQKYIHYTYAPNSPDQAIVWFDPPCMSIFTITWNATLNRSETQRSGPC